MRSFAYWPTLALLALAVAVVPVVRARAPASPHLGDLTADPARWDGKRVQVSGVVGRFDSTANHSVRHRVRCWSFMLVGSAKDAEHQPVWVLLETREQHPGPCLCEGQKVTVTGRYHRNGCIFSRPKQLQVTWPRQSARQQTRSGLRWSFQATPELANAREGYLMDSQSNPSSPRRIPCHRRQRGRL